MMGDVPDETVQIKSILDQDVVEVDDGVSTLFPYSPIYTLASTPEAGRGVYATQCIEDGTLLFRTSSWNTGTEPVLQDSSVDSPDHVSVTTSANSLGRPGDLYVESKSTTMTTGGKRKLFEPLSPTAYMILRPYRREVCAECFAYDRGREWKVKLKSDKQDLLDRETGLVVCSDACRREWIGRYGEIGIEAFAVVEALVRKTTKKMEKRPRTSRVDTVVIHDDQHQSSVDSRGDESTTKQKGPSKHEIEEAWLQAEKNGQAILRARLAVASGLSPSKAGMKILRKTSEADSVDCDVLYLLLTGVLSAYLAIKASVRHEDGTVVVEEEDGQQDPKSTSHSPRKTEQPSPEPTTRSLTSTNSSSSLTSGSDSVSISGSETFPLPSLLSLIPDPLCYNHPASHLDLYTTSYLQLQSILPLSLLFAFGSPSSILTPFLSHTLSSSASHNAFSIHSFSTTSFSPNIVKDIVKDEHKVKNEPDEFLGWGIWPQASFFNHSCEPTITKLRSGRCWHFFSTSTSRSSSSTIQRGKELCITYLGGDERELRLKERRKILFDGWGFWCQCTRCVREECEE